MPAPLPENFVLSEKQIKDAIREYVAKLTGVDPNQVAVGLDAKQRGFFGSRADFSAPISFVQKTW